MDGILTYYHSHPGYYNHSPLFPDPIVCFRDIISTGASEVYNRLPWSGLNVWLKESIELLYLIMCADCWILLLPVLIALLLTALRAALDSLLFKKIPKWYKINGKDAKKFPESLWKSICYSISWSWALYCLSTADDSYFFNLKSHYTGWHPCKPIESSIYWLYMFQLGSYLHYFYAMVYLEEIRKDFHVMVLHHTVTILQLLFSYTLRVHKFGLLILFFHDIGDVLLESAKVFHYLRIRDGKEHNLSVIAANVTFAIFTLQHVVFRLYWYPAKAIYSSTHVVVNVYPGSPFFLLCNLLLWVNCAMQVYWFRFIVQLLVKVLVHKEEISDIREHEDPVDENGVIMPNGESPVLLSNHTMLNGKHNETASASYGIRRRQL